MRTGRAREMRHLIRRLTDGLALPVPADPDALFAALTARVAEMRGRQIVLLKEEFPQGTATGLWLELPEQDVVVVDRRAAPVHQLAILCHEIWHMTQGDCGHHTSGSRVAARVLSDRADLPRAVGAVAARTEFNERSEQDAETFALRAVTRLRVWLEGEADGLAADRTRIAGRITASLGHHRSKG
ncbi:MULTISPECIES: toxin-antitoxin system, toxin component [unclassified Streptomyces]|uniref:toxin-antitoxin system, toxin component n=1 Tax=unclassified Streptomyces TaxID=2593676 RepID=UPI00331BB720